MWRVIQAFFKAWYLVLTGRAIQPPAPLQVAPEWQIWLELAEKRLETVFRIAEKANVDVDQRKAITLTIDKRNTTMETILRTVEHNLKREYPSLLQSRLEHSTLTIRAFNLNDVYRIEELVKMPIMTQNGLQNALNALLEHLKTLPDGSPYVD